MILFFLSFVVVAQTSKSGICFKIRDSGTSFKIQEIPGKSGRVGSYAYSSIQNMTPPTLPPKRISSCLANTQSSHILHSIVQPQLTTFLFLRYQLAHQYQIKLYFVCPILLYQYVKSENNRITTPWVRTSHSEMTSTVQWRRGQRRQHRRRIETEK